MESSVASRREVEPTYAQGVCPMQMETRDVGAVRIVRLSGALDAVASGEVRKQLSELVREGTMRLVIDLAEVSRIDSTGSRTLPVARPSWSVKKLSSHAFFDRPSAFHVGSPRPSPGRRWISVWKRSKRTARGGPPFEESADREAVIVCARVMGARGMRPTSGSGDWN